MMKRIFALTLSILICASTTATAEKMNGFSVSISPTTMTLTSTGSISPEESEVGKVRTWAAANPGHVCTPEEGSDTMKVVVCTLPVTG